MTEDGTATTHADADKLARRRMRGRRRRRPRVGPRPRRPGFAKRLILRIVGWTFLFLGVLGLFLPILQGILFLLIGVFVLAQVSPRVRLFRQRLRAKARSRYPQWTGKFEEAEARAKSWINRVLKPRRA